MERQDVSLNRWMVLVLGVFAVFVAAMPAAVGADSAAAPAAPPIFALTLIKAGAGDGSTTPDSGPAPGVAHTVAAGATLRLIATPAPGSAFADWSGDLPPGFNPQEDLMVLTMDQNRTITATFMPVQCTLTVKVEGTASPVNVTPAPGTHGCLSGRQVFLNALPADGSPAAFMAWSGDVTSASFAAKVVMDGNKSVTVHYTDVPDASRRLVVNPPQGPGAGTCFPLGPGTYRVAANTTLKFGANPFPGSYFGGWLADYAGVNPPQELSVAMDRDRTLGASFSNTGNTVTVILEGLGDILPGPGTYALTDGLQVPFTARRIDHDWYFDGWRDGSDKVLSENTSYTVTVRGAAPLTVKGVFTKEKKTSETIARLYDTPTRP